MKKVIFFLLAVSISSALIISCAKSDPTPATNFTYITEKPWVLKNEWAKSAIDSPWKVIDTALPICFKEEIYSYTADSRFSVVPGAIKCDTTKYAPTVLSSGTWSLQNNETTLVTGTSAGSKTFTIEYLNDAQFQISFQDASGYYRQLFVH